MKFKKPSETKVKDTIALTGGVVAGSMASKALFGFVHDPTTATDSASLKKDENTALVKRGVIAVAGVAGAMFIDGNDSLSTLVKGLSAGIAVTQVLEGIRIIANRSGIESEAATSSTAKKALARAVGLGCACNSTGALNAAVEWAPRYDLSNMDHNYQPSLNGWGGSETQSGLAGWGTVQLSA